MRVAEAALPPGASSVRDLFPRSPSKPLLLPSLSHFAAELGDSGISTATSSPPSFAHVLWSAAEAVLALPRIEQPGEKGGDAIYVERTLLDAFLPFNATVSVALAFVTSSALELTRTNKINDLVEYIAGEEPEGSTDALPPSLPWEWDRVGHDTVANLAKDCGSQTLTRYIEKQTRGAIGSGASYCELLKHAHKAACKEYHTCAAAGSRLSASAQAARVVVSSPTFYGVRALTAWLADISVDAVAWWRGQLSTAKLSSNATLKLAKYSLSGTLCLFAGAFVPFFYPHPFVFIGIEQLAANILADTLVAKLGTIEPS